MQLAEAVKPSSSITVPSSHLLGIGVGAVSRISHTWLNVGSRRWLPLMRCMCVWIFAGCMALMRALCSADEERAVLLCVGCLHCRLFYKSSGSTSGDTSNRTRDRTF